MKYLIEFLQSDELETSTIFKSINCDVNEVKLLQEMTKSYIDAIESTQVISLLKKVFGKKKFAYLTKVDCIKTLLSKGWLVQNEIHAIKLNEISNLELLHTSISLSISF